MTVGFGSVLELRRGVMFLGWSTIRISGLVSLTKNMPDLTMWFVVVKLVLSNHVLDR